MATIILSGAKVYAGSQDVSGVANSVALKYSADGQEDTVLSDTTHSRKGGLKLASCQLEGLWDGSYDGTQFSLIGANDIVVSICPTDGTLGERAFAMKTTWGEFSPGGSVGDLMRYSLGWEASKSPLVRGTVMHTGSETTSTSETGSQLGAVSSSESMYCALHVLSASGTSPTLDVIVESDDNAGFTSAITQATFTQQTAAGYDWQTAAGAITDDYWRVSWTIGGTASPTFDFVVVLGII
jgi:hypothetical protein